MNKKYLKTKLWTHRTFKKWAVVTIHGYCFDINNKPICVVRKS